MAHRSQSSSVGDNPLSPNYLPPHYREEYRMAIDALIENDSEGYYEFLRTADVVPFLAQPEMEHMKSTLQIPSQSMSASLPELTYQEGAMEDDGSSDTYWPVHSDLDAPGLDMGWPLQQHSFVGPTEVTTLVNPSDPETPSIKEQARRLIKNAHHVIAVVMDIFTDVDIFSDLLDAAARHVPVYILLDEQNSHHFVTMVNNCKVNLDMIHMMRVRTVAGITYYCRTGKSFKGQVKDRFLLADCRAVISGNYSFMWSYEKIHRCIAHLFLGELVASFDEEFRILFAQSEPLVIDQSLVPLGNSETNVPNYLSQFGLKRSQSLRSNRSFPRHNELPSAFPYGDSDRNPLAFRRNDPFRHTMEPNPGITIGKYSQQQFHLQQSFLDQGRSVISRQMEVSSSAFKRHSYAEGTQESYSSSKQYMKHRVMNNLDETDNPREPSEQRNYYRDGTDPGSGHGHYDRLRRYASNLAIDQRSESSFTSELEPPAIGSYRDYFSSDDLKGPEGLHGLQEAGRYEGGLPNKRPSVGQPYACQNSPTQPHPPEKQQFEKQSEQERDQDPNARQGMRNWRISSYLNTCEDGGEEGLAQAMGPDAFDDAPSEPEGSTSRYGMKEIKGKEIPSKPRSDFPAPRYGKPVLPVNSDKDSTVTKDLLSATTSFNQYMMQKEKDKDIEMERDSVRAGTREGAGDAEVKEGPEVTLSKHDSFRTRVNPMLMRSSRLRSSLIFSSSKVEKHSGGLGLKPATEEDEDLDHLRTTSIVAQMLEKRKSLSREPFEWRRKTEDKDKDDDEQKQPDTEKRQSRVQELKETFQKASQGVKTSPAEMTSNVTAASSEPQQDSSLNMNDPASRLQYFQDLAAKRKASKMGTESSLKAAEPVEKKSERLDKTPPSTATQNIPSVTLIQPEPEPEPKKLDISSRLAELTRRSSTSGNKPPMVSPKPLVNQLKPQEQDHTQKEVNSSEVLKKEPFKSLKPFPSPKLFRRDPLKLKALNPRRVSASEETLTADTTDAEKSELKKSRSHSSSTMMRSDSKDVLNKNCGSNTSINTIGSDGKSEGKPLDFLKKQTQRLKGFLGPKDKDKDKKSGSIGDDKSTMRTVMEVTEDTSKKSSTSPLTGSSNIDQSTSNHKVSTGTSGTSRYQSSGGSVLFSSNLRDDTKVILGQISAQKNRQDHDKAGGAKEGDPGEKGLERQNSIRKSFFPRPQPNTQEREGLLKRIESMRKEKKVYSRFEMGNNLG